jgi:hypothetical protein
MVKLYEKLDADFFYYQIRPHVMGFEKVLKL